MPVCGLTMLGLAEPHIILSIVFLRSTIYTIENGDNKRTKRKYFFWQ